MLLIQPILNDHVNAMRGLVELLWWAARYIIDETRMDGEKWIASRKYC